MKPPSVAIQYRIGAMVWREDGDVGDGDDGGDGAHGEGECGGCITHGESQPHEAEGT